MKEEKEIIWTISLIVITLFGFVFGYFLGFSHQTFLPQEEQRYEFLCESIEAKNAPCLLEVYYEDIDVHCWFNSDGLEYGVVCLESKVPLGKELKEMVRND